MKPIISKNLTPLPPSLQGNVLVKSINSMSKKNKTERESLEFYSTCVYTVRSLDRGVSISFFPLLTPDSLISVISPGDFAMLDAFR